jgi:hypothetical protein
MKKDNNTNPYHLMPAKSFWKTGVVDRINAINYEIYVKKFSILKNDKIVTAGSCFAQHIGKRLQNNGFLLLDYEKPIWSMSLEDRTLFGYEIFSGRYGNIYTVKQLLQLVKEVYGLSSPEDIVWQRPDGKFVDALRPNIEPFGLNSYDEVIHHRKHHLKILKKLFNDMNVFIFTLGLTETWKNKITDTVYPTVPGLIAGEFDSNLFELVNYNYNQIKSDLKEVIKILDEFTFKKKYIFTVSPVPLTATATNQHVMVANTYSKSVLRAVVGDISFEYANVDYFPSYEIVANPWVLHSKYDTNQRSVLSSTVDEVMNVFLFNHDFEFASKVQFQPTSNDSNKDLNSNIISSLNASDPICEEMLLNLLNKDHS